MIRIRRAGERGHADHGWLKTYHTFSFADYHDPRFMGFRTVRVINDDRLAPGKGFPTHAHRDMEIVSYVVEGALAHRDSIGNASIIRPGDVQRISAGTGVTHSEFNPSETDPMRFLQIWVIPSARGLEPGYEQKYFPVDERRGRLRLIASGDGRKSSLTLNQDADIYAGILGSGDTVRHEIATGRGAWIQVVLGSIGLRDIEAGEGDGLAVEDEDAVEIDGRGEEAEILVFDVA